MKITKQIAILGITALVLINSLGVPSSSVAQEPGPVITNPYGAAGEKRRPNIFAKQDARPSTGSASAPTQPSTFANEHRMVFESYRDNQYEVYAADGDGNGAARLTTSGANRFPKLRYGAITLAFTHGSSGSRDLWSVRKDGSEMKLLSGAQGHSDVAWSPDGTKLAYARRGTTTDVYVASFDFAASTISNEICLTCGNGRNNFEPSWSPDGKQLIFVKASATEAKGALWAMNADGSGAQAITGEEWWIADVRWSPDRTQVAFDYATSKEGWQRLGVLTLATGAIRDVYNPNQDKVDAWMGSWSPDSQMLFFTRVEFVEQNGQLYIDKTWIERVNADGSGRVRLPGNSGLDAMPSLQKRDLVAPTVTTPKIPEFTKRNNLPSVIANASDTGGAGLKEVTVLYRKLDWGYWLPYTYISGDLGETYYFAAGATDWEGNASNWIGNDLAIKTTIYAVDVAGKATDNRGVPLPRATVKVTPADVLRRESLTANTLGEFAFRTATYAPQFISVTQGNTRFSPVLQRALNEDLQAEIYVAPESNLLMNGSFESENTAWSITPSTPITFSTEAAFGGQKGILLGKNCDRVCLQTISSLDFFYLLGPNYPNLYASFIVDAQDRTHLVWLRHDTKVEKIDMYISNKDPQSGWITPTIATSVSKQNVSINCGARVQLTADATGTLHAAWSLSTTPCIPVTSAPNYYSRKTINSDWEQPITISDDCNVHKLTSDKLGRIHVLCFSLHGVFHTTRSPSNTWSPSQQVGQEKVNYMSDMFTTPDNITHLIWQTPQAAYYRFIQPDGQMSEIEKIGDGSPENMSSRNPSIAVDQLGNIHVYWIDGFSGQYNVKSSLGKWSSPQTIELGGGGGDIAIDTNNAVHLVNINAYEVLYRRKLLNEPWSKTAKLGYGYASVTLHLDSLNQPQILEDSSFGSAYHSRKYLTETVSTALSQTVFISNEIRHPTLTFLYQLEAMDVVTRQMTVEVDNGISKTPIPVNLLGRGWRVGWVDLSTFVGQTVTLSLIWAPERGTPDTRLFIDDISLGSWLTPVPTQTNVPQIPVNAPAQQIAITGTNFIATPTVMLNGSIPLANVQWLSETQLVANLPANLPRGTYDLWVTNPGGQESVLPGAIKVGTQLYFPVVRRDE